ncbi:MAG: ABC transporter ATP-binding protein [Planctomycetes bacterium]|nr:ABC transporter ATP-binding protein [Planctomycetota bacterium]
MTDTVIEVAGLGKRYRVGTRARYRTLRDVLASALGAPFRIRAGGAERRHGNGRHMWALKDVSFSVGSGEVLGVIGRNGAGKTTLLKVLARITEPTEGRARVRGRVGSLLEVGTGFHPELTGRENVFLNGAILGMSRSRIRRVFDPIVDFSGVERHIDTPVKYYSTGMGVRLAFAVAAHLEPDVLLVDEVLAVGDANFQKKCLRRMEEAGWEGRTVLFVSHSMPAVLRLCQRVILLDGGRVVMDGRPGEAVGAYLRPEGGSAAERTWDDPGTAPGDEVLRLRAVRVVDRDRAVREGVDIREPVGVQVEYWNLGGGHRPMVNLHFFNEDGVNLFVSVDGVNQAWRESQPRPEGLVRSTCWVPGNFLSEGRVYVMAAVSSFNPTRVHAMERDAVAFQVVDRSEGDGARAECANYVPGVIRPLLEWEVEFEPGTDEGRRGAMPR